MGHVAHQSHRARVRWACAAFDGGIAGSGHTTRCDHGIFAVLTDSEPGNARDNGRETGSEFELAKTRAAFGLGILRVVVTGLFIDPVDA